jgi:hypothetical protein
MVFSGGSISTINPKERHVVRSTLYATLLKNIMKFFWSCNNILNMELFLIFRIIKYIKSIKEEFMHKNKNEFVKAPSNKNKISNK